MDIMVIGIAGGPGAFVGSTGAGKTTITKKLVQRFGGDVSVIYHDNYYKAHHNMPYEERAKLNYDHPDSFDTDILIEDLKQLRAGHSIKCPVYDYSIHDRTDRTITVKPARVIIVEGILIFQSRELCDLMDIKIFVDTDADERLIRNIQRDTIDRGRTVSMVVDRYLKVLKPMHEQFIEPTKRFADIIIPQGGENLKGIDIVCKYIEGLVPKEEADTEK